jgi:hypothetical protein
VGFSPSSDKTGLGNRLDVEDMATALHLADCARGCAAAPGGDRSARDSAPRHPGDLAVAGGRGPGPARGRVARVPPGR